jgi:dTDP-4-amino-4,6-dideoxygalactose transaminase
MFYLVAPDLEARQALISHLRSFGVSAAFHFQPLHSPPAGSRLGRSGNCPVSVDLGDRLVRLPIFTTITEEEVGQVISSVRGFIRA